MEINSEKLSESDWEERERERKAAAHNDNLQDKIAARKSIRYVLLGGSICWFLFIATVIMLQGFNVNINYHGHHIYFNLNTSIINCLLGSTTVSIIGLCKTANDYFFEKTKKDKTIEENKNAK